MSQYDFDPQYVAICRNCPVLVLCLSYMCPTLVLHLSYTCPVEEPACCPACPAPLCTYVNYMSLHMNLACGHEYKEIVRTCLYSSCTNTIRIGVPNTTPPQDRATCNAIVGL
jgi:hypothetical protein